MTSNIVSPWWKARNKSQRVLLININPISKHIKFPYKSHITFRFIEIYSIVFWRHFMLSFSAPQPRNQGERLSLFLLTELNFFEFQANFSLWIPNSAAPMPWQVMWFFSDRTRHRAIKGLSHGCFKSLMVDDRMIWVAWWLGHLHWFRIEVKLQWSFMFDPSLIHVSVTIDSCLVSQWF